MKDKHVIILIERILHVMRSVLLTGCDINLVCEGCIGRGEEEPRYSPQKPD